MSEQVLWKIADVAKYLRMPLSSVYRMTAPKGALRIPHVRIAGRLRFRQADIDQWLEVLAISNTKMLAKIKERIGQGVVRNGLYS